jgi:16S rRNA (cytidine1402-2'-O)-methyltransferase
LRALREALGDRPACVARELTKLHEEVARGLLSELAERFAAGARGEVTIVVSGELPSRAREESPAAGPEESGPTDLDARIRSLLDEGRTPREVAARLAKAAGVPKRDVYARCLALRGSA